MHEVLDNLIHLNLQECKEVLRAVQDRIKILEQRTSLANTLTPSQVDGHKLK